MGVYKSRKQVTLWLGITGIGLMLGLAILSMVWTPYDAFLINEEYRLKSPSRMHWLGTDILGRDLFSRMMVAGRVALMLSFGAMTLALLLAFIIVFTVSVLPHWIGRLMMMIVELIMILPTVILALVMISLWGSNMLTMLIALAVANIPRFVKVMLASIHEQVGEEYLLLSRSLGNGRVHLMIYHHIPALRVPIIQTIIICMAAIILSEASLSFLGLGIMPPNPSWGYAMSEAKQYFFRYPHLAFAPLFFIFTTILSLNLLSYSLSQNR